MTPGERIFVDNGTLTLGGANVDITSDQTTIQFPASAGANGPMISMYASGTGNADRMVIAHSPNFSPWGLAYSDVVDEFYFQTSNAAVPMLTVDMSTAVGILTEDALSPAARGRGRPGQPLSRSG